MRFLRRNALGVYAVYAAAIVSGLVVTPVVIHSLGTEAFGIWSFIGSVTIYLSILDLGVGPSIVRFGAEARGREAPEDVNAVASAGLAMYAAIALVSVPIGLVLAWIVPIAVDAPDDLVWDARVATLLVVAGICARFPLGLFNNLLIAQQRWDVQNLANLVSTVLYAVLVAALLPHWGGLVLLASLSLGTTLLRLALPLFWLRVELPLLRLARRYVTRARIRDLAWFSWSNFLLHVANKIVFSTDVIVVGVILGATASGMYSVPAKLFGFAFGLGTAVTTLMYPAFAELEGAGAAERQRRLLLAGLRGGMALMLVLALPLLLIPDLLIDAWIGSGYEEAYPVMALLALVLLVHQPIFVLTQFLIARAQQREVARASIAVTFANLVLSIIAAAVVGIWGVALATLVTDAAWLVWTVVWLVPSAAGVSSRTLIGATLRPAAAASVAAAAVLVGVARAWQPDTLAALVPLGVLWLAVATAAIWRFALPRPDRDALAAQFRRRPAVAVEPAQSSGM